MVVELKWKIKPIQIPILILLITSLIVGVFQAYSWVFPSTTTITINAGARYNPTQAQTIDSGNIYVVKNQIKPNNVTFPNRSLKMSMGGVGYWINITQGSNQVVNIWQWFTSNVVILEYTSTGTYVSQLYVGNLGAPTVTGADISSYNPTTKGNAVSSIFSMKSSHYHIFYLYKFIT